ncbi:MAG: accessory gene regulator B family protein [Clostridia bacterium]|nr:accessory gene regulator B family protein [Clostridia bacterium]
MVNQICNKLMDRVRSKMPEVDDERAEVIRYGFELLIGEVPKLLLMFVLAALLGKLKYFLISLAIICPYRTFSGGIHLKTHIGCFITTNLMYLGNVYFSEWIKFNSIYVKLAVIVFTYIFAVTMIILYAPADTETVPILRKNDRRKKKIEAIVWATGVLIISFCVKDIIIGNMCVFGILFQTLTITKLSYKIFNVKLGYLEYIKSL